MFSRQARRFARKFRKNGLDKAQQLIAAGLERVGVAGSTILEIGCGVGGLHLSLLKRGGVSAVGVEVSGGMIVQAKELSRELGVSDRVTYCQGDFVSDGIAISPADIVVMDKVLCCYANPVTLIERSAKSTIALFAVSYPRAGWLAKLVFGSAEHLGSLLRWSFYPFYHHPAMLDELIRKQGFEEVESATTPVWQVKIFRKQSED